MRYVLDTNALSALLKGDEVVADRLKRTSRRDVYVPQPVIAEIEYGIEQLKGSRQKQRLRDRFELFKAELKRAEWTDEVSAAFGMIKAKLEHRGKIIEDFDIAIAAHAIGADTVLVTSDTSHMTRIQGLSIENWKLP